MHYWCSWPGRKPSMVLGGKLKCSREDVGYLHEAVVAAADFELFKSHDKIR
jgi:hypothetical protein